MSKAKAQGTTHESWIVKALEAAGITARRLAEGGADDEGDVEAGINGERWILEGKARQTLNVQATLGKERRKAGGLREAVVCKLLVKVAGYQNRQPVEGERIVVVLGWDDFMSLVLNNRDLDDTVNNTTIEGEQND
jgi:hypothetical protein